jgi:hypothetical protein
LDLFGSDVTDIGFEEINENNTSLFQNRLVLEQPHTNEYYLTVSFLVPNKNIFPTVTSAFGTMINPYIREYKNVVITHVTQEHHYPPC